MVYYNQELRRLGLLCQSVQLQFTDYLAFDDLKAFRFFKLKNEKLLSSPSQYSILLDTPTLNGMLMHITHTFEKPKAIVRYHKWHSQILQSYNSQSKSAPLVFSKERLY